MPREPQGPKPPKSKKMPRTLREGNTMGIRTVCITLFFAALLGSNSSAMAADIRPEVARPLDEARVLANGWSDKAHVIAKLNQAASVPNLNTEEEKEIRATTIYALARAGSGGIPGAQPGAPAQEMTPSNSLNNSGPLR